MNLLALAAVVALLLPKAGPPQTTAEVYQELFVGRALRSDVRGEDVPPPVSAPPAETRATTVPRYAAPVVGIRMERVKIDAAVVALNLTPQGAMDVPNSPELVAWYDFTGKPGLGGNAVFSGHVDWRGYGPAIFWRLKELVPGDKVEVRLLDGTILPYAVTASWSYPVEDLRMAEILAQTAVESLTLITCGGEFSAGQYSERLIVRATRIATR